MDYRRETAYCFINLQPTRSKVDKAMPRIRTANLMLQKPCAHLAEMQKNLKTASLIRKTFYLCLLVKNTKKQK